MLHVTNGDSAVNPIREATRSNDVLPWRDVLHEGPTPADLTLEKMSDVRSRFLADCGWAKYKDIRREMGGRDAALALDRDLLRDLLGAEELRELLDPEVIAALELELQRLVPERRARHADDLHDLLSSLVATRPREAWAGLFAELAERDRVVVLSNPAGEELWATAERATDAAKAFTGEEDAVAAQKKIWALL